MKKNLILFFLLFALSSTMLAQKRITGNVKDAGTSESLPGVNVLLKGTVKGTITDMNGNYSIEVPNEKATLTFSFIGYLSQDIQVGAQSTVNVVLKTDVLGLDEVVVVGYGTMKKSDLSGASVSVSGEKLKGSIGANLDQALQGRAAGVTAVQTSGQPGASVSIRVRGQGTLSANAAEPLYVVDGVPVQNTSQSGSAVGLGDKLGNGSVSTFSGLSAINPSDILSMEILKDASATAIYGSRGANGVVLITTKRGKSGDAKFSYEYNFGVQDQVKRISVMNLREYAQYSNDYAAEINGRDPRIELLDPTLLGEGTNWQDAIFRSAPMQSHQINATGGSEKVRYFISGSYYKQDGTVIGSDFNRFTTRVNLDADLKKGFKIGTNFTLSRSEEHIGLNNSSEGIISVALRTTPDVPIYNTDGTYSGDEREGSPGNVNPIGKALNEENLLRRNNFTGNVYSDVTIIKGLTWRSEISADISGSNAYTFTPTYQYGSVKNLSNSVSRQYNQGLYWELKNYLTYTRQFGKHNITAMLGQEVSESSWEYLRGASSGLTSNDIQEPTLGDPKTMTIGSGHGSGAMASFFARGNYAYNDKYFATYTFRQDGSSNFGPKNRWAPFHAFSVSWKVSNESFMDNMKNTISNFKIRAGWGQTGNANIGGYRWGAAIAKMPTGLGQGFRQTNIANPFITWEKQEQVNLGFDLGFFNNRIDLVVDLYDKTSSAMLMSMQLPSYMGTSGNASIRLNPPMGNFGKIQNRGVEITLNTKPVEGDFSWNSDLTVTINKNKLLGLTGTPAAHIEGYGQWTDLVSLTEIGDPLYNFYGYKVAGIYKDKEDILNSPKPKSYPADGNFNRSNTIWPGDIKFADLSGPNGTPDGIIDEYDRTNIGSPLPLFTFGFNNIFRYKNIELNVFLNGSVGNKLMNYVGRSLSGMESMWGNQLVTAIDRAKTEPIDPNKVYATGTYWFNDIDNVRVKNPGTNVPRNIGGDPNDNMRISDRYIEDGSYLRFKNITLAYYVPKSLLSKARIDVLKVFANVQNMWTITKYTGFDPEVGTSQASDNVYGLDNGRYPSPRIVTFGLNITF
jgi:TonB-linked SusC/RagA family outer membrane protein